MSNQIDAITPGAYERMYGLAGKTVERAIEDGRVDAKWVYRQWSVERNAYTVTLIHKDCPVPQKLKRGLGSDKYKKSGADIRPKTPNKRIEG